MNKCQRTIHLTNYWGKAGTRKCGRIVTKEQPDGLPVCERHYNKWIKKMEKKN